MDDLIKKAEEWINADLNSPMIGQGSGIMLALLERVRELEAALEQIIYEADEYEDSATSELVSIARKALGRG